jgi:hypothetical protein
MTSATKAEMRALVILRPAFNLVLQEPLKWRATYL